MNKIDERLFENLPQRIFYKNTKSEYIFCNNNYARDLNIEKEDIVGKTDIDFYPEDLANKYVMDDKRIISTGKSEDIEERYILNGHEMIIHTVKTPIKNEKGEIDGILGIFWDVTEQKRIEDALVESQKRYKNFFENSPIAILEEDFFNVKLYIDQIKQKQDIKEYFENNPEEIIKCISLIKIVDVNKTTLELFKAPCKESFLEKLDYIFPKKSYNKFIEELVAISNGITMFECEDNPRTFLGEDIHINLKWCVAPGHEKTYSRVLVSMVDITEKKRSEHKLKLLSTAIEEAPNGVQILDLDGRVVYSNKAVEKIYGFSKEEYNGIHVDEMNLDPDIASSVIIPAIKDRGRWAGELKTRHKHGYTFPIWLDASMVRDDNNNPIAMVGIINDITEYKNMREEIKDRERFLNSVFESIQDGICILDKELKILRVNPTYKNWYSLDNKEFIGKKCYEIFYGRQKPCKDCPSQNTLDTGKSSYKIISRVLDGKKSWIEVFTFPMMDINTGELRGVVEVVRDVTKQKDADDLLRKAHDELEIRVKERTSELEKANKILQEQIVQHKDAEERIREQATLLDNAQDAIIARDLDHKIRYWNKGAERIYGWSSDDVIGEDANKLLYRFDDVDKYNQLRSIEKMVLKEGKWSGELSQTTKDNKEIIVESRWTLMRDTDNNPKLILVINTNITEKKRLLSQLLRAQRMESIGTLAGGIAHDLNNVLTPIMLSTELLKEKIGGCEENQKLLSMIEKNTERGANLIKQVLSFARGIEGVKEKIQMSYIISEIEKIMKETFPKNISIQTEIQKDLWTIVGDATQLHQVLMNLCVNARDAMPYGGNLQIYAENFYIDENYVMMDAEAKVGNYIIISVKDNGVGIPIEIQDRIFEPFFTTKEVGKGTGLGLSTAHAVVKGHGGFIHLYSELGNGTKFKVYLPAKINNVQEIKEKTSKMVNGNGELILVSEDEESIREITRSTLKSHGYNVIVAEDGAQALALYAQYKDDIKVVIMDIMMPVLNGQDSIRAIRRINPDANIIAVSGLMEKDKLNKIADIHINGFLSKPFTGEKLLKSIAHILNPK